MSDETSAAIADDTKQVAGIIRQVWDGTRFGPPIDGDAELCQRLDATAKAVRLALQAGRAAASSDLDAIKREAAREALTRCSVMLADMRSTTERIAAFRDREYPAPVPEPPHVMVNGWRVTWDEERNEFVASLDGRTERRALAVSLCIWCSRQGEEDVDVVRVLALREGREARDAE